MGGWDLEVLERFSKINKRGGRLFDTRAQFYFIQRIYSGAELKETKFKTKKEFCYREAV